MTPHTLSFDTETTGIPKNFKISPNNSNTFNWDDARVIEIAWIISDKYGNVIKENNYIIKPTGTFNISENNKKIHGYSQDYILNNGRNIKEILTMMIDDIDKFNVNKFVAHNFDFDKNVILSEIFRMDDLTYKNIFTKPHYCTMKEGTNITKLQNRYGYKRPKLSELCKYYNIQFDENYAHNALYDTTKTLECYNKMIPPTILSSPTTSIPSSVPIEINISKMKVVELKKYCKENKIKDYSKLNKKELIETILNHNTKSTLPTNKENLVSHNEDIDNINYYICNQLDECPFCGIPQCHCGSGY
ncbi:MAG: hypothetical protein CMM96_00860 [Rickettsiales bacterium]|nr:hypothetical protein [Rickettsiales bacterium]